MKRYPIIFMTVLVVSLMFCPCVYAHAGHDHGVKIDQFNDGGKVVCKLKGSTATLPRKVKLDDNSVFIDELEGEAEFEFEGDVEQGNQDFTIEIEVEVEDIDIDALKAKKTIRTTSDTSEFLVEVIIDDDEFGIVALNEDINMTALEADVVVKAQKIKEKDDDTFVSGRLVITYPRTVKLAIDDLDELLDLLDEKEDEKEENNDATVIGEIDEEINLLLENAEENGAVKVVCKLKNVPFFSEEDDDFDDEDFDD